MSSTPRTLVSLARIPLGEWICVYVGQCLCCPVQEQALQWADILSQESYQMSTTSNNRVPRLMLSRLYDLVHTAIRAGFCYFFLWPPGVIAKSSHPKSSFVVVLRVSHVFVCCDGVANEHKILFSTRITATEIHKMPETIHENEVVFHKRVCKWFKGSRGGWENLEGGPRVGWLSTAQSPGTVAKFVHW